MRQQTGREGGRKEMRRKGEKRELDLSTASHESEITNGLSRFQNDFIIKASTNGNLQKRRVLLAHDKISSTTTPRLIEYDPRRV